MEQSQGLEQNVFSSVDSVSEVTESKEVDKSSSENLPAITDRSIPFPERQIKGTIKNVGRFVEKLCSLSIPDEIQILGSVNKTISRHSDELIEEQEVLKKLRKNRVIKDKSIACYLQEKKLLKIIHISSTEMSGIVSSLSGLSSINKESIDQITKLDINITDQVGKDIVRDAFLNGVTPQKTKVELYDGMIDFLTQMEAKVRINEAKIGAYLQQQESLIQAEHYNRAQKIEAEFRDSTFYQVVSKIKIAAIVDNAKLGFKSLPHQQPEEINDKFLFNTQFEDPKEILQFHKFDIEDFGQHPDYQVSCHYLTVINSWVENYLLNEDKKVWKMIIEENPKLREVTELANKLFENIKSELRVDWMEELRKKLDFMTNKKNRWKERVRIDDKKKDVEYELRGDCFLRVISTRNDVDLISLNGEYISTWDKICPEEADGRCRAERFKTSDNPSIVLLDSKGKVVYQSSGEIGKLEIDGTRIVRTKKKYDILNSRLEPVLHNCDEISDLDDEGNRNTIVYGYSHDDLFRLDSDYKVDLLEEFIKIGKKSGVDFMRIAKRKNGKYILLDSKLRLVFEDCDEIGEPLGQQGDRIFRNGNSLFKRNKVGEVVLLEEYRNIGEPDLDGNRTAKKENGKYVLLSPKFEVLLDDCDRVGGFNNENERNFLKDNKLFAFTINHKIRLEEDDVRDIEEQEMDGNRLAKSTTSFGNVSHLLLNPKLQVIYHTYVRIGKLEADGYRLVASTGKLGINNDDGTGTHFSPEMPRYCLIDSKGREVLEAEFISKLKKNSKKRDFRTGRWKTDNEPSEYEIELAY